LEGKPIKIPGNEFLKKEGIIRNQSRVQNQIMERVWKPKEGPKEGRFKKTKWGNPWKRRNYTKEE